MTDIFHLDIINVTIDLLPGTGTSSRKILENKLIYTTLIYHLKRTAQVEKITEKTHLNPPSKLIN